MRTFKILLILALLAVAGLSSLQDLARNNGASTEAPALTSDTETVEISVHDDDSAILAGVTATDAQDGDLTDQVLVSGISKLISDNTAKVTYVVFDSDDNMATLTRNVRYTDYQLPRFSLEEPLRYTLMDNAIIVDRLKAHDIVDGDISNNIRISFNYPNYDSNNYSVTAQVTNSLGDTAWLTLPIVIVDNTLDPMDVYLDTYLVYLEQGADFDAKAYLKAASYQGLAVSLGNVSISGEVDTDVPGTYNVTYTGVYGDHHGTAILTVVVE